MDVPVIPQRARSEKRTPSRRRRMWTFGAAGTLWLAAPTAKGNDMATEIRTNALPQIVSREEWQVARDAVLERAKAHTRAGDAIAAERRRLPRLHADDQPDRFH